MARVARIAKGRSIERMCGSHVRGPVSIDAKPRAKTPRMPFRAEPECLRFSDGINGIYGIAQDSAEYPTETHLSFSGPLRLRLRRGRRVPQLKSR